MAVRIVLASGGQLSHTNDGGAADILHYNISDFKLQSCYYIHFWTDTLGKGMNPLILPAMD